MATTTLGIGLNEEELDYEDLAPLRFDYKGRANAATTSREINCDDPAPFDSKRAELT